MITPSFYLALATFTRQGQQLIGIQHETAVQAALYGALDDSLIGDAAKQAFANELRTNIERDRVELDELLQGADTVVDKNDLLHTAKNIEQRIVLAVECLEVLANG